jgi:hypothetical protein
MVLVLQLLRRQHWRWDKAFKIGFLLCLGCSNGCLSSVPVEVLQRYRRDHHLWYVRGCWLHFVIVHLMVFPWWASLGCHGVAMEDSFLGGPQRLRIASRCLEIVTLRYTQWSYRCCVYQNSTAWGHRGDPLFHFRGGVGHAVRSPRAFCCSPCLRGCKWKLCEVGVASALFIGAPTTTTLSFQTPLHVPSWVMLVEVLWYHSRV